LSSCHTWKRQLVPPMSATSTVMWAMVAMRRDLSLLPLLLPCLRSWRLHPANAALRGARRGAAIPASGTVSGRLLRAEAWVGAQEAQQVMLAMSNQAPLSSNRDGPPCKPASSQPSASWRRLSARARRRGFFLCVFVVWESLPSLCTASIVSRRRVDM
jgi:hypothetical protein